VVVVTDVQSIAKSDLSIEIHITLADRCGRAGWSLVIVIPEVECIGKGDKAVTIAVATLKNGICPCFIYSVKVVGIKGNGMPLVMERFALMPLSIVHRCNHEDVISGDTSKIMAIVELSHEFPACIEIPSSNA